MKPKSVVNPLDFDPKAKWKKVKLKGNVVSEDGFGMEGLIGLEVLKSYNTNFVSKFKKKLPAWKVKRELKRKLKESQTDGDKSDQPKENQTFKKKLPAWKEKRELKRKLKESQIDGDKADQPKEKRPKKIKKKAKLSKNSKQCENNTPGKFVLLKPPTDEENEESLKNNQLFDELEGWNGLGIPDSILRAVAENGFKSPTEIQALTLPSAILGKKDILGAAETGSGKTLAFGIPILTGIMELKSKQKKFGVRKGKNVKVIESNDERENCTPPLEELINFPKSENEDSDLSSSDDEDDKTDSGTPLYALILTPTRELAVQVKDHIVAVAKYTGIKVATIFGGLAIEKQERVLKSCPEIVVATPGRLWELLEQGNDHLNKIDEISFFVIDETDRMVEKGHFDELQLLLNRLNSENGNKETRQNFVFSATLSLVHDLPDYLQKKNVGKKHKLLKQTPGLKIHSLIEQLGILQPKIVDITQENQTARTLTESRIMCQLEQKDYYLYYFLRQHPGRSIVFCNSIECVKRLSQLFGYLNCNPLPLHANMIQKQRLKNLEKFRDNPDALLIATDVAARGLDIPNVQHVIHYQVPRTSENYVHRSGRTARASKDGLAILIMEPGETKYYLKLCRTLDRDKDLPLFPISDRHLNAVKELVDLAREVDKMELKSKRKSVEEGWLKKSAEEMEIIIDGFEDNQSTDDEYIVQESKDKLYLINKRKALAKLLNQPLFPKGFSYKYPTNYELPFNNDASTNSAVNVMKTAIEELKEMKKQRNKKKK